MAMISVTEAARRFKVGRTTIYDKMRSGELSYVQGQHGRELDPAEVSRVFGEPSAYPRPNIPDADGEQSEHLRTHCSEPVPHTPNGPKPIMDMTERHIHFLEKVIEDLNTRLDACQQNLRDAQVAMQEMQTAHHLEKMALAERIPKALPEPTYAHRDAHELKSRTKAGKDQRKKATKAKARKAKKGRKRKGKKK